MVSTDGPAEPALAAPAAPEVTENATEATPLIRSAGDAGEGEDASRRGTWAGLDAFEGLPWWRTPSVYWIVGPFALFILAFGGTIVPKLNLIVELVCKKYLEEQQQLDPSLVVTPVVLGAENPQCKKDTSIQKKVTALTLVMNLVIGILSALVAPRLGRLSDRHGRRRLMALASCGGILAEVVTIVAVKFPDLVDYRWLVLGAVFEGSTGSFTAGSLLGHAYVSDCTPPSRRGVAVGYLHACIFTGLAFGPLLAGLIVKHTESLLSIFYVALGCHLLYVVVVSSVVPESLPEKKQQVARDVYAREQEQEQAAAAASGPAAPWLSSVLRANPLEPLRALVPRGPGSSPLLRRNLVALAGVDTVLLGAAMSAWPVILLYSEFMFRWGTFESSIFLSSVSFVRVFVLLAVFPAVNHVLRVRPALRRARQTGEPAREEKNEGADRLDIWVIRFALASDILGAVGYLLARSPAVFFASGVVTAFGGLGSAMCQTALSKHVPPEQVGSVLGAVGLLHALGRVGGPLLFNGLYYATIEHLPQAVFVLLTCFFALSLLLSAFVKPKVALLDADADASPRSRDEAGEADALLGEEQMT